MADKIPLIIFIVTMSTVFPLAGYYLDYRHRKKQYKRKDGTLTQPANQQQAQKPDADTTK